MASLFLVMNDVMDAAATCHERERERVRESCKYERAKSRANRVRPQQRFQDRDQSMPEFGAENCQLEKRTELRSQPRRQLVPSYARACHRREGVVRRDDPRQ